MTTTALRRLPLFALAASLICCGGARALGDGATVEGTVQLPKAALVAPAEARYQGGAAGPMAPPDPPTAVVYLEGSFPPATSTNAPLQMSQKNLQFSAALLPVQIGTVVEFPNQDDIYHNVFSYSKAKRFDLGRYLKDEKPAAQRFDKAGVVKLYCEIHSHMRATILVLDTPYFQKTDTNGTFRLTGLPAGKFTLKAWADEKNVWEKPVELKDGETLKLNFPGP